MGIFDSKVLNPSTPAAPGVLDQMRQSLATPEARAALLQFGVSMLTPQWGGFGAALGQSVGNAGEAVGRVQASEAKQARTDQQQAYQEQSLDARKQAIEQAGEITMAKLEAAKQQGGISATALFGAKSRDKNAYRRQFLKSAADAAGLDPQRRTAEQIAADPEFQKQFDASWAVASKASGQDATVSANTGEAQPAPQAKPAANAAKAPSVDELSRAKSAYAGADAAGKERVKSLFASKGFDPSLLQ